MHRQWALRSAMLGAAMPVPMAAPAALGDEVAGAAMLHPKAVTAAMPYRMVVTAVSATLAASVVTQAAGAPVAVI